MKDEEGTHDVQFCDWQSKDGPHVVDADHASIAVEDLGGHGIGAEEGSFLVAGGDFLGHKVFEQLDSLSVSSVDVGERLGDLLGIGRLHRFAHCSRQDEVLFEEELQIVVSTNRQTALLQKLKTHIFQFAEVGRLVLGE